MCVRTLAGRLSRGDFGCRIRQHCSYMKTILCFVLSALLLVGVSVAQAAPAAVQSTGIPLSQDMDVFTIQDRLIDLGFLHYRATGNFGDITTDAVRDFQSANNLPPDGMVGAETMRVLFSDDAVRAPANPSFKSAVGRAYTGTVKETGELSSWESISSLFPVGAVASVKDYNTGEVFELRRTGGTNNAEVTTLSETDAEKFEYVFGGFSWEHRPVLVTIDGTVYAASLFGMPRTIAEGTDEDLLSGVTFLYFNNSRSDVQGLSDEEHAVSITGISA